MESHQLLTVSEIMCSQWVHGVGQAKQYTQLFQGSTELA